MKKTRGLDSLKANISRCFREHNEQRNRIEVLEKAMHDVLSSLENDQSMYDRNGPDWTTPAGNEYESTASVLACSEDRAETLRKALHNG